MLLAEPLAHAASTAPMKLTLPQNNQLYIKNSSGITEFAVGEGMADEIKTRWCKWQQRRRLQRQQRQQRQHRQQRLRRQRHVFRQGWRF